MKAPFVPPLAEDNFDAKYTNSEWKDANSEAMVAHQAKLKRPSIQKLFEGYYHDENLTKVQKRDGPSNANKIEEMLEEKNITAGMFASESHKHNQFVGGVSKHQSSSS